MPTVIPANSSDVLEVTIEEVKFALKNMKLRKAQDEDGIVTGL